MKLLICTQTVDKDDPILGFFHDWVLEFAKHFESISVICLKEGIHALPQNVKVYSLGKESGENRIEYLFRFYRYFGRIFFHERVDFALFHMGAIYNLLASPFFIIRRFFNTKFYWWKAHGHINLLGKLALLCVDRVYTASPESFPIESKKRFVVGHGIGISEELLTVRERNAELQILCVGRVTPVKDFGVAIEVGEILREYNIPYTITIVGDVVDEMYMQELQSRIEAYGLTPHITLYGAVSHDALHRLYQNADVLLHPSKTGSIDKVVLEAMYEGVLPVALCGAYGDMLALFNLCVGKDDPIEYSNVLRSILDMSTEEYNRVRVALQKEVRERHSLKTLSQRIFNNTK